MHCGPECYYDRNLIHHVVKERPIPHINIYRRCRYFEFIRYLFDVYSNLFGGKEESTCFDTDNVTDTDTDIVTDIVTDTDTDTEPWVSMAATTDRGRGGYRHIQ